MYLTFPVKFISVLTNYFQIKREKNVIKKHPVYLSGEIQSRNALTMDTRKVKSMAKKQEITINDLMMTLAQMTFKSYFELKGDPTSNMSWVIPFSFKGIPQKPKDYSYGNKFVGMLLNMNLEKSFEKALHNTTTVVNKTLRNNAAATYIANKMYIIFYPHFFMSRVLKNVGEKATVVFSNVAGFVKPVNFHGCQVNEMFFLATAPGSLATGLSCMSTMNRLKVNICSDKYQLDDVDAFIGIFNDLIKIYNLQMDDIDRDKKDQ